MNKLSPLFILILFLVSCKKLETEPPVVTIFSPTETDSFYVADSVRINFTVSDKNLRTYKIIISNFYNKKLYFKEENAVIENSITIDKKLFVFVNADTTAYLNILGIDKNGNTGGAGVKFKIKK